MVENRLKIYKASKKDLPTIRDLILGLATYEKRPEAMTASQADLNRWLFDRQVAQVFLAEYEGQPVGYALFYPSFSSFAGQGKAHLEDLFILEEYRNLGIGKALLKSLAHYLLESGFQGLEWSALSWNQAAINFYIALGAGEDKERRYFEFGVDDLDRLSRL